MLHDLFQVNPVVLLFVVQNVILFRFIILSF